MSTFDRRDRNTWRAWHCVSFQLRDETRFNPRFAMSGFCRAGGGSYRSDSKCPYNCSLKGARVDLTRIARIDERAQNVSEAELEEHQKESSRRKRPEIPDLESVLERAAMEAKTLGVDPNDLINTKAAISRAANVNWVVNKRSSGITPEMFELGLRSGFLEKRNMSSANRSRLFVAKEHQAEAKALKRFGETAGA